MAGVWERYVTPPGRAGAGHKGRKRARQAATVAAVAATAVCVAAVPLLARAGALHIGPPAFS